MAGAGALNGSMATKHGSPDNGARREAENEDVGGEVALKTQDADRAATGAKSAQAKNAKGPKSKGSASAPSPSPQSSSSARGNGNVGNILRGAYRQTVEEAIPDDLMDLLNRLE